MDKTTLNCSVALGKVAILLLLSVVQSAFAVDGAKSKLDLIVRSKVTIDRPVRDVWPHFLDMAAWMNDLRFQHISGERGAEGEVRLATPGRDQTFGSYFITTVRMTPLEQYVVKVVPEHSTDYFGFADFSFAEAGGQTHITYDIYIEFAVPAKSEAELLKIRDEQHADTLREVSKNNQNLKALVEASASRQRSSP